MEAQRATAISVLRYVLIVFGVRFVAGAATVAYALKTGQQSPVGATPILIGAVGIAMLLYWKAVARPMSRSEIVRFSIGNALIDVLLSVGGALAYMSLAATAFSWESFKTDFLGLNAAQNATTIIGFALLVGSVEAFLVSALFAWFFPRTFSKSSLPDQTAK